MKKVLLSLIVCSTMACSKNNADDNTGTNPAQAQTLTNITYGTDARQTMDIYLPANRTENETKLLVLVHGGGWTEGDKSDFNGFISELQQRLPGYAIANINYRLVANNQNLFPTAENDVKAAIQQLISKAVDYKYSKKLVLFGASAGAHLALLYAYKHNNGEVKAVGSMFGPTELVSFYNAPPSPGIPFLLEAITGGSPGTKANIYHESSPYNYVSAQSPPTIIFHGGLDVVVPPSQSVKLKDKLASSGVANQYVFYANQAHGWFGTTLDDTFDKTVAFFQQHVK
ncbi:MAG: alpha/beta hydrolase [Chitinophagaceae bacterium]|nr:alpha/beta hydrolase [Chitinophagaceae bacterium]